MSDIPEEIRKMFPNQPIHKMDIDDNGNLLILASSEPLENEPDFEHMPIEQVNQYLRDHGYDPEQVGRQGKILVDALIENINLKARAEAAERELAELKTAIVDGSASAATTIHDVMLRNGIILPSAKITLELARIIGKSIYAKFPVPPEAA